MPADDEIIAETFLAPIGTAFLTGDTEIIERPGWYQIVTPSMKHPGRNEVIYSVIERDIERVINDTCARYESLDVPFKWSLGPLTRPTDMAERLAARGFSRGDVRGMYCEPQRLNLSVPDDVTVQHVDDTSIAAFTDAFARGWEITGEVRAQLEHDLAWAVRQPAWQLFAASVDGDLAATGWVFLKERSGYLMAANVLPPYRGRGLYRALLEARMAELRRRGIGLATTQAREATSAPILERLGFATAYRGAVMRSPGAAAHL